MTLIEILKQTTSLEKGGKWGQWKILVKVLYHLNTQNI